jgi:glycosyltransferase involved in cell wall biosynthesis
MGRVDDMAGLMARSDVILVPSFLEATPYVILEAMAAGKPVIASAIYGIPELIQDGVTGILTPPGDPEALTEALLRISGEPGIMKKMGLAGRKRYEDRFTLKRSVAETVSVYEELF